MHILLLTAFTQIFAASAATSNHKALFWDEVQEGLTSYAYFLKEVGGTEHELIHPCEEQARWEPILQNAKNTGATFVVASVPTCALSYDYREVADRCERLAHHCNNQGLKCVLSLQALEGARPQDTPQELWSQAHAQSPLLEAISTACATSPAIVGVVLHEEPKISDKKNYSASCASLIKAFRRTDSNTPLFVREYSYDDDTPTPLITTALDQTFNAVFPTMNLFAYPFLVKHNVNKRTQSAIDDLSCVRNHTKRAFITVGHNNTKLAQFPTRHAFFTSAITAAVEHDISVSIFGHWGTRGTCLKPQDTSHIANIFAQKTSFNEENPRKNPKLSPPR